MYMCVYANYDDLYMIIVHVRTDYSCTGLEKHGFT